MVGTGSPRPRGPTGRTHRTQGVAVLMAKIYYFEDTEQSQQRRKTWRIWRKEVWAAKVLLLLQAASKVRPGCSAPYNSRAVRIKHLPLTKALCYHPLTQWQSWNWLNIPPGTTSTFLTNLEDVWVCTLVKRDDESDGNSTLCWSTSLNHRQRKHARVSCEALWGKCPLRWKQQMKGKLNCSHRRLPFSFTQPPSWPNNHLTFSGYVSVPEEKGPHLTPLRAHRLEKIVTHRRKHTAAKYSTQETAAKCSRPWAPQSARGAAGAPQAHASAARAVTWEWAQCPAHRFAVKTHTGTTRARPGSLPPLSWPPHNRGHSSGMRGAERSAGRGAPREQGTGGPLLWSPSSPPDTGLGPAPGGERLCQAGRAGHGGHPRARGQSPEVPDQALCSSSPRDAHGALGIGVHVSSPATVRPRERGETSYSPLNNRIKVNGWTDRKLLWAQWKAEKKAGGLFLGRANSSPEWIIL